MRYGELLAILLSETINVQEASHADRPFWIVDGRAYDLTEWMGRHPGGAIWFAQTEGRDISALLHTYHRDPARLQKILAKYLIEELADQDVSARPMRLLRRKADQTPVIAALVPEGAPVLSADEIELVPGPGFPRRARSE